MKTKSWRVASSLNGSQPRRRLLKRLEVDYEAVTDIGFHGAVISLVNFGRWNEFDLGEDILFAAVVEHLLSFTDAADQRASQLPSAHDQRERLESQRLGRRTDQGQRSAALEKSQVGVDIVFG